ncbi:sporulation protein [Cytobacillus depressus]|uniref:Sporulation protein n=1 Tax=Cytobacillus depressus TaxID=1602942 RepID=A0A6L3V4G7_9BACI|nr:sporulation protein [Cytobacillus depressus]
MKKSLIILGICGLTALTACQNQGHNVAREGNGIYERSGNTLNVNTQRSEIYNRHNGVTNNNGDFGYVRHQRSPIMGENVSYNKYATLDREQLADLISGYCTDLPNVDDVSTLVTDEEVLVIYDTNSNNRNLTADQVKRTAMSVVPRSYHVYVSDNTALRKYVENFANSNSNNGNLQTSLNKVINEMLKSPQGKKIGNGENENGEKMGERKNKIDNRNMK